ncbi:MAG: ROK family protein [Methyloceanibacter sp.]|uniref:ROK family protein n=1 Tax=Methyloceanibacter sp. TaxID=1965321 RepID=UPI003D6CF501
MTETGARADGPLTLVFDIGGSHLKAGILSPASAVLRGPSAVSTPHPAKPEAVVEGLLALAEQLGRHDRVTIGFPGVVRGDAVITAPNLGTDLWSGFKLAGILHERLGKPVRMLNDATVQGLGAISGTGVECVLTMGTGMGFALFDNGRLAPHLEMSQHPIKTDTTYDQYVGEDAHKKIGRKHWNKRVRKVIDILATVVNYDLLYIGGGNARLIEPPLPDNVKTVSNLDGITGGVKVWDKKMDQSFTETSSASVTVA